MHSTTLKLADLRCGPVPSGELREAANRIAPELKKIMISRKPQPERICFVTGFYRSGTTWVSGLIHSHPDAYWLGETNLSISLLPCLRDALFAWRDGKYAWATGWVEVDWVDLAFALRGAVSGVHRRFSSRLDQLAVEKSPENTHYAPFLSAVWPEAAFVHVLRDPRDVIVSLWLTEGHSDHSKWPSFDEFARATMDWWRTGEEAIASLRQRGLPVHTVSYEELFRDPSHGTAGLYDFLGLANTPELVARAVRQNSFEAASGGRKLGQEDRTSHLRQGLPGDWRHHMSPSLAAEVVDRATPFWSQAANREISTRYVSMALGAADDRG